VANIDLGKTQAQLDWLKQKLYLDSKASSSSKRVVKRGQVYNCELGIGIGMELQKRRPCVILQNDIGNMKSSKTIVIPVTHTNKTISCCFVPISNKINTLGDLILDGYANVSEIKVIDKARLGDYICSLDKAEMKEIDKSVVINLEIYHYYKTLENQYNDKLIYIEKLNSVLSDVKHKLGVNTNSEILKELQKLLDNSIK